MMDKIKVCPLCGGKMIQEYKRPETIKSRTIGPRTGVISFPSGSHCSQCGIRNIRDVE